LKKSALRGKTAVITGAAGGIGTAVADLFHSLGVMLVLADINKDSAEKAAGKYGDSALAVQCDVTEKDQVKTLFRKAKKRFGNIDILVNNAGIIRPGPFESSRYPDIDREVAVNLAGAMYCTREAVPYMLKSGGGAIVTVSSLAGIIPETFSAVYSATKFGLRGFSLTLNVELKNKGIHAAAVFPDSVDTPMLQYEAAHNGSPLTFLSDPQPPSAVAKAVLKAILKKKIEIYVPWYQGPVCKLASFLPGIIPVVWPFLEKSGEKKKHEFDKKK